MGRIVDADPADLDDISQEAFVAIHRMLPGFEGRSSLETWLNAVAWRVASHYHRRSHARFETMQGVEEWVTPLAEPVLAAGGRLHEALDRISADQRDLLALHEVGGPSIAELSEVTGSARATVRERLARARAAVGRRMVAVGSDDARGRARPLSARVPRPATCAMHAPALARVVDGCSLARFEDTVIGIWRGTATAAALQSLAGMMVQAAREQPAGISYLSVVEASCRLPPRAGRDVIVEIAATLGPALKATAWALMGSDLRGLVPAVVNACVFLSRAPLNMRFFADVSSAAAWLARYTTRSDAGWIIAQADALSVRRASRAGCWRALAGATHCPSLAVADVHAEAPDWPAEVAAPARSTRLFSL